MDYSSLSTITSQNKLGNREETCLGGLLNLLSGNLHRGSRLSYKKIISFFLISTLERLFFKEAALTLRSTENRGCIINKLCYLFNGNHITSYSFITVLRPFNAGISWKCWNGMPPAQEWPALILLQVVQFPSRDLLYLFNKTDGVNKWR